MSDKTVTVYLFVIANNRHYISILDLIYRIPDDEHVQLQKCKFTKFTVTVTVPSYTA